MFMPNFNCLGSPQLDPGGRLTPILKSKPPPIAPKPRPKSVGGAAEVRLSGMNLIYYILIILKICFLKIKVVE